MVTYTTLEGVIAHLQEEAGAFDGHPTNSERRLLGQALTLAVTRLQTAGAKSAATLAYNRAKREEKPPAPAQKPDAARVIRVYTIAEMTDTCRVLAEEGYWIVSICRVDSASHVIVAQLT
jgi:hypothetical protein